MRQVFWLVHGGVWMFGTMCILGTPSHLHVNQIVTVLQILNHTSWVCWSIDLNDELFSRRTLNNDWAFLRVGGPPIGWPKSCWQYKRWASSKGVQRYVGGADWQRASLSTDPPYRGMGEAREYNLAVVAQVR